MRSMKGWLYNVSRAIANPFAPMLPLQDPDHRLGDRDVAARLTLKYVPTTDFTATLKLLGSTGSDDGTGVSNQVVGCINAKPAIRGIIDPFGEASATITLHLGCPMQRLSPTVRTPPARWARTRCWSAQWGSATRPVPSHWSPRQDISTSTPPMQGPTTSPPTPRCSAPNCRRSGRSVRKCAR